MKTIIAMLLVLFFGVPSQAQISKVSLQASGLTCSMCSKAVKNALEGVSFVDKVQVDIKNQQYNISFKEAASIELDALAKAVEDAGFAVASLMVTANLNDMEVKKDDHIKIGEHYFHFLNAKGQRLSGSNTFTIVDKQFVSAKDFKKYSSASKMQCVQTGRAASCCTTNGIAEQTRIYHAII